MLEDITLCAYLLSSFWGHKFTCENMESEIGFLQSRTEQAHALQALSWSRKFASRFTVLSCLVLSPELVKLMYFSECDFSTPCTCTRFSLNREEIRDGEWETTYATVKCFAFRICQVRVCVTRCLLCFVIHSSQIWWVWLWHNARNMNWDKIRIHRSGLDLGEQESDYAGRNWLLSCVGASGMRKSFIRVMRTQSQFGTTWNLITPSQFSSSILETEISRSWCLLARLLLK
jgi:hypothetical protein